ncbi:hypothetical protein SAMN02745823_03091 [Sporobacter termitidis DSM 10068]|uniref:YlxP-like protein n=1 Tax=Sporobacter termitidis DSM 10068 TaxID=1123282 RepID=A0A1M5Z1B1_9FIRM|nr:DUF503 domain-containing protein [Sporobacter termitidis]SHI18065.1 hypothetical protein SAMN02745823_03091 [Sporobacter termitidis DSM 10068]
MIVAVLTVTLRAEWVHSLKEKRSVLKSLLAKIRNNFNVSAAETGAQDVHQTLILSVAALAADHRLADGVMESILRFTEQNTDAEIVGAEREYR